MAKWKGKKVKKAHADSLKRAKEFRDFYERYSLGGKLRRLANKYA
jgi:hypothetical protein